MEYNKIPPTVYVPKEPLTPRDFQFTDERLPQLADTVKNSAKVSSLLPSERDAIQSTSVSGLLTDNRMPTRKFDVGSEAFVPLSDGSLTPRFERYMPGINNEEILALGQSRGEKWANGLTKLVGKTSTAVLGATIGSVEGLIHGVKMGSLSAVYDSDFNHYLEDLNKKLDYKLPNYYTEQEKNMNFFQKMGTANFWANDFTGGLSFMLGTVVSEGLWAVATGGTSLIARGAMGTLGRALTKNLGSKSFSALKSVKEPAKELIRKGAKNEVKNLQKAAIKGAKITKGLNTARFLYTSSGYEAGVEARGYMSEAKMEWKHQFEAEHGRRPNGEEEAAFERGLTNSANMLFAANTALVGASNYVVLGNLLLGKGASRNISNNVFKKFFLGSGYKKVGPKLQALKPNKYQKAFGKVYGVGKPMVMEGFVEEGGQAVMSKGATAYMLSAYDSDANGVNLSMIEAFAKGLEYTYGTKEGLTEVGLGALIGILGGGMSTGFKFNDASQEQKQMEETVKYVNAFTQENLINQLKTSARAEVAHREGEQARANGNLTEANRADTAASIAVIERSHHYQSTDALIKDFETAIDVMDVSELAQELGLTVEEAQEWKDNQKENFIQLASTHTKNLEFAEAYIGDTNIAGLDKVPGLEKGGIADLKAAVAFTMTMGEQSDIFAESLALQIKNLVSNHFEQGGAHDAITVQEVLRKVSASKIDNYRKKSDTLKRNEDALFKAEHLLQMHQIEGTKAEDTAHADKLKRLNKNVLRAQEKVDKARKEKDLAYDALNIPMLTEEVITEEMLDNQTENVRKLSETIEQGTTLNPQETQLAKQLITEYSKATQSYKNYNALVRDLVGQKTRVSLLNGWAAQIANKKKKVEGDDALLFQNMISDYRDFIDKDIMDREMSAIKTAAQEAEQEAAKVDKTQDPLNTPPSNLEAEMSDTSNEAPSHETLRGTVIAKLKAQIQKIIGSDPYSAGRYSGEFEHDIEVVKPTEAEVNRYQELLGKIAKGKNIHNIIRKGYNKKNKTGLTKAETQEFINLNKKLNNWKVLSGLNINDSSIAEILEVIHQLENATGITETKITVKPDEMFLMESKDSRTTRSGASLNTIVTPDIAVARKVGDNSTYEISFLNVTSLPRLFPGSTLYAVINGKSVDVSTIPEAKLDELSKENGAIFYLKVGDQSLDIKIDERQRLVMDIETLENLIPDSALRILDFGNSSFLPLFEKDIDGNYHPLEGDFDIKSTQENEIITVEGDRFYELEPGTIMKTTVNLNDAYNAKLIEKYNKGIITEEELINNINIYISLPGAVDNILGTLRAIKPSTNTNTPTFAKVYMIRRQAVRRALASTTPRVDVGITLTLSNTLMGKPNLTVREEENGLVPNNISLTDEALNKVDDYGYVIDGELKTSKNLDYSETQSKFAIEYSKRGENLGKKIPVIVFQYKNKTVVFPVSLNRDPSSKAEIVSQILQDPGLSDAAKIYAINQELIGSEINPNDYAIADLETEDSLSEVRRLLDDLKDHVEYAMVEEWLDSGFRKEKLKDQVQIAIDITDKPFNSGMGLLDLGGIKLPNEDDMLIESVEILSGYAQLVEDIFRREEPFRNMPVKEWKFYEAYIKKTIKENPESFMLKQGNAYVLKRMFAEPVPKPVKEALGEQLIKEIKKELKQFEVIKEGSKTISKAVNEGPMAKEINNIENNCN